jgi:flagellar motility protein MotE (MotC chaperone)
VLHSRYRLLSQLGAGGMGSVWLAEDLLLERTVALKELIHHIATPNLKERRARALREARALARVKHPAIVRIYDVFFVRDDPWIVMEHINGRSLAAIIKDHPLDDRAIARIGLPVLRGLSAAHGVNVLHRDVKPTNILVADDDSILLVDFGIAKIADDLPLTGQSQVLGTTEYMAPERFSALAVGPSSDLWSLGVTLYYAMEGRSPFLRRAERSAEATMWAILRDDPPRPARPGRLADVVLRLLCKEPDERVKAAELVDVLQAILDEPSTPAAAESGRSTADAMRQPRSGSERPESAPKQRPGLTSALRELKLADAGEAIRDGGTDVGAAMLLAMPGDQAAEILAGYPPRLAGDLIAAIAAGRPEIASAILQMLTAGGAGHIVDLLSPGTAASIVAGMPAAEAVRVLGRTSVRTAAGVIMELPGDISARLISAMQDRRAAAVLTYVKPVTVASLLLLIASDDLNGNLLRQFSPAFRAQVLRHL